jgi:hypothetical protein
MSVSHLNDGSNPYADLMSEDPEDLLVELEGNPEETIQAYESSDKLSPMLMQQAQQLELNTIGQMLAQLDVESFTASTTQAYTESLEAKLTPTADGKELSTLNAIAQGTDVLGILSAESGAHPPLPAPVALDAVAASQEQIDLAKLLNPASVSTGGPYWAAELPWKRDTRPSKDAGNSSSEKDEDQSSLTRKRRDAWRQYQETALERRLNSEE